MNRVGVESAKPTTEQSGVQFLLTLLRLGADTRCIDVPIAPLLVAAGCSRRLVFGNRVWTDPPPPPPPEDNTVSEAEDGEYDWKAEETPQGAWLPLWTPAPAIGERAW